MPLLFAFLFIMFLVLLNQKQKFIFYIPFLLQLADIIKIMTTGGPESRASILMDYSIIITSIIICLYIILTNIPLLKKNTYGIFILVIYFLVMILFSSDIWWSFKRYLNVALGFLIFPATFILVNNINDIKKIIRPVVLLILIFLANAALCSSLGLTFEGEGFGYGKSFVDLGSVNFYSCYGFVYSLTLLPLAYYLTSKMSLKYLYILLYFAGLFTMILVLKRTYIYLTIAGALIYMLFMTKRKSMRFIGPFFIIGLVTYVLLSDVILSSIAVRKDVLRRGYAEEGRGIELLMYPQVVSISKEPGNFAIFGEELFNSMGKFVIIEKALNDKNRLLHSDIATILYGAGIIGLVLFVRVYYLLIRKYLKYRQRLKHRLHDASLTRLYPAFLSLLMCMMLNAFSDGIIVASNRVLPYMMLGAILGLMYKKTIFQDSNPQTN